MRFLRDSDVTYHSGQNAKPAVDQGAKLSRGAGFRFPEALGGDGGRGEHRGLDPACCKGPEQSREAGSALPAWGPPFLWGSHTHRGKSRMGQNDWSTYQTRVQES